MSQTQRTLTVGLWALVVVSLLGLLAMTRWEARASQNRAQLSAGVPLERDASGALVPATQRVIADYRYPAPQFALVDQQNQPFDSSRLKGKVWTAIFFFSECTGVCPAMTERIESLQKVTPDARVECVSFSVDPTRDTPEKLAKYAAKTHADPARWHFLTGDPKEIHRVAAEFKFPFVEPTDHTSKILLIDQQGVVRKFYSSQDTDEMFRLQDDIKVLLAEPSAVANGGATR